MKLSNLRKFHNQDFYVQEVTNLPELCSTPAYHGISATDFLSISVRATTKEHK